MKKTTLLMLAVLFSLSSFAQANNSDQGIYKQMSIEAAGKKLTDMPVPTYRCTVGNMSILVWIRSNEALTSSVPLTWRVEFASDASDPFSTKIKNIDSNTCIVTWYNFYDNFFDFPQGIWIDETWKKVTDDVLVKRISDVATKHTSKENMLGSWVHVASQVPDETGDSLYISKFHYKIYGEKDCMMYTGSLYNIESEELTWIRPFQWVSDNEFLENAVLHKVNFVTPQKMTLEYKNDNGLRIVETWIRHDIPEPLATLLSNFK